MSAASKAEIGTVQSRHPRECVRKELYEIVWVINDPTFLLQALASKACQQLVKHIWHALLAADITAAGIAPPVTAPAQLYVRDYTSSKSRRNEDKWSFPKKGRGVQKLKEEKKAERPEKKKAEVSTTSLV